MFYSCSPCSLLIPCIIPNQNEDETKSKREDIAAGAQSIQPKGNTLETTTVSTKIPFLLKHSLREYQHIGLDWLVAMYNKKLNGILAVSLRYIHMYNNHLKICRSDSQL